jgi:hypothetical protein
MRIVYQIYWRTFGDCHKKRVFFKWVARSTNGGVPLVDKRFGVVSSGLGFLGVLMGLVWFDCVLV